MPEGSSCPTFQFSKWTTSEGPSNIPLAHCLPVLSIQLLCSLIPPWYIEFWRFPHPKYFLAALKYYILHKCYQIIKPICIRASVDPQKSHRCHVMHTIQTLIELTFKCGIFKFPIYVLGFLSLYALNHWQLVKINVTVIAQWSEHATSWWVRQSTVDSDRTSGIALWSSHAHPNQKYMYGAALAISGNHCLDLVFFGMPLEPYYFELVIVGLRWLCMTIFSFGTLKH